MGHAYAEGLAGAVTDGLASLEQAIAVHLSGNFHPPLPLGYVEPIMDAILAVEEDEPERMVGLPGDLNPLPREAEVNDANEFYPHYQVRAGYLLDITKAWAFVQEGDDA